jgi:hypothetical protein
MTSQGATRSVLSGELETPFEGMKHPDGQLPEETGPGRTEKFASPRMQPSKKWRTEHPEGKGLKPLGLVFSERQVEDKEATDPEAIFHQQPTAAGVARI